MAGEPTYDQLKQRNQKLEQELAALRQTKELLAKEKLFSEATLESLPGVFYMFDPTGRFVRWNDTFRDVTGYSDEEISGMHPIDFVAEEHRKVIAEKIQETFEKGNAFVEADLLSKNGRKTRYFFTGLRSVIGENTYLIGAGINVAERKQTEKALRKSQERYQILVEGTDNLVTQVDEEGKFTFVNYRASTVFGLAPETCIGLSAFDFVHPDDKVRTEKAFKGWINNNVSHASFENRQVSRSGNVCHMLWTVNFHYDSRGDLLSVNSIARDITERKQAEEALADKDRFLSSVLDCIQDGIAVRDKDLNLILVNPWAMKKFAAAAPLVGKKCYDAFHGRRSSCPNCPSLAAMATGRSQRRIMPCPSATKGVYWLEISAFPLRDAQGRITGTVEHVKDVTEQRQAEKALRKSEEKYRLVSENIPVTVYSALPDTDSTTLFISGRIEELTGYSENQFMEDSRLWQRLLHPEDRDQVWKGIETHRKHKTPLDIKYRIIARDGTMKWVRDVANPVLDNKHDIVRIDGFMEDITERKNIEAQLLQTQKMEAVGTLAGGIAHDFNNILGTIIGYGEMMEMFEVPEGSDMRASLTEVLNAAYRGRDLVEHILAFGRQTEQKKRSQQMKSIIEETLGFLEASLPSTIEIRQEIDGTEGPVSADATQMHRVLMNLCINAAQAMEDKGGILEVRLSEVVVDEKAAAPWANLKPGTYVKLTVSDNGAGMGDEVKKRIFDPYLTTKEPGKGTGLGLSITHGIIKAHGGAITVDSEMGLGSAFHVFLPKENGTQDRKGVDDSGRAPQGKGCILIVDDEEPLTRLGKQALGHLGYEVVAKTSSQEALKAFRGDPNRFDLVITDLTMPKMTGIELSKELLCIRPNVPVILCTGYGDEVTADRTKAVGIRAVVKKPLGARRLLEIVHNEIGTPG